MPDRNYGYYDADPTQPPDLSSLPHAGYARGGVGSIGSLPSNYPDPSWRQRQVPDSRQGAIGLYQAPKSRGAIGELPQSSGNVRTSVASTAGLQQRVAKVRLGDTGAQLQVYRKPESLRGHGQAIGQYNIHPTRSTAANLGSGNFSNTVSSVSPVAKDGRKPNPWPPSAGSQVGTSRGNLGTYPSGPAIGTTTGGPSMLPGGMGMPLSGQGMATGGPSVASVGSVGPGSTLPGQSAAYGGQSSHYQMQPQYGLQQAYSHQPLIGRMATNSGSGTIGRFNSASTQMTSPFVPASTNHPINNWPSRVQDQQSPDDMVMQQMSTGNLSALESISQFGSMSQTESGEPPINSQAGGSRNLSGLTNKVKAVCSSGGHFVKLDSGGLDYQGGETRLVQIPNFCQHQELLEALERLTGFGHSSSESADQALQVPSLKYQLPTEPNVYVDLVDDTDAELMFDEWLDFSNSQAKSSTAKLHLFVDWLRNSPSSKDQRGSSGSVVSLGGQRSGGGSADEMRQAGGSADEVGRPEQSSAEYRSTQTAMNTSQDSDIDQKLKERMEVINPKDVTLVKFLGSGGYGEVYLGKWHSSEAAVKCLNPSLFFSGGPAGRVAKEELMREAALLGSLRHPNVVWVYGIVLADTPDSDDDDSGSQNSDNEPMMTSRRNVPHRVRAPAIITEYLSQGSVKMALQRSTDIVKGALMRVLIAMDAAKGMEYLHSKNIVHFDLKSANLLLGWRDRRAICKVADFGLSKQKRETFVSNVSSQRGTLPWIAPEIIKNPTTVNEKVDVFSFGVVLWELWTGKEPYDGLNYHALYHQMTTSLKSLRPSLPGSPDWDCSVGPEPAPGYQALMERCWSESPYGRPSFHQIVKALKDMATSLRPAKRSKPPSGAPAAPSSRSTSKA